MTISNEELLRKATLTTTDFGGTGAVGMESRGEAPLSIEQADRFLVLLASDTPMLSDVRRVTSRSSKWQESVLDFASRVLKPGTEATRLTAGNQVKPDTGLIEISTVLLRGEVPVSDEAMEDAAARANFADDLVSGIASRVGFDVEDLMLNGDTASADAYLALLDGWLQQADDATNGHTFSAAADGQDYQTIFRKLVTSLPDRYKRNLEVDGRFYVPQRLVEKYRDILAARGTALGDLMLTGRGELRYQGILIKGVPSMAITAATPDTSHILLTNRNNLYAGFRREVTFETWRDPREGATSFVVTTRVDAKVAIIDATAIATSVNVEP